VGLAPNLFLYTDAPSDTGGRIFITECRDTAENLKMRNCLKPPCPYDDMDCLKEILCLKF
jgi:hypothetical protein